MPMGVAEAKVTYNRKGTGTLAPCTSSRTVAKFLNTVIPQDEVEHFVILLLDARNRAMCWQEVAKGTAISCPVTPREVFRLAVCQGAISIICSHNHPSGDPEPSADDLEITRRLARAGKVLGITVLDHIIIGEDGSYVSLAERGILS